jgi:hypothetical protein
MPGIYNILCKCGKVYIGKTGHSIETRIEVYHWHIQLHYPDKSSLLGHSIILNHHIQFNDTSILAKKPRCMERIIKEVIKIELPPDNMNSEEGFSLSKSWKPLI